MFREDLAVMGPDLGCPFRSAGLLEGLTHPGDLRAFWREAVTPSVREDLPQGPVSHFLLPLCPAFPAVLFTPC